VIFGRLLLIWVLSLVVLNAGGDEKSAAGQPVTKTESILWGPFSTLHILEYVKSQIEFPLLDGTRIKAEYLPFQLPKVIPGPGEGTLEMNAFNITNEDYEYANHLVPNGQTPGPAPHILEKDALWFKQLVQQGVCPKFFVIAGHQVISHGWHNDAETKFMFLPTFLDTLTRYPEARKILNCVKVAILFGCNTMTNLEPHHEDGSAYSTSEIVQAYNSGPAGKAKVIGTSEILNTLEFYRARLAREYGPSNPEGHYDYYRNQKPDAEVAQKINFRGHAKHIIENVDRVFPDEGMFDGRYNYPVMMKKLFPNAAVVVGFSSASPNNNVATAIFAEVINATRVKVNKGMLPSNPHYIKNILYTLADEKSSETLKREIVASIRHYWPLMTYKMNRGRPSGSISPQFPDLDRDGIIPPSARALIRTSNMSAFGPYEAGVGVAIPLR